MKDLFTMLGRQGRFLRMSPGGGPPAGMPGHLAADQVLEFMARTRAFPQDPEGPGVEEFPILLG